MSCCWRYYLGSGCWADGESARAAIYDFSWRLDFVNFNMEICSLKHLISLCLWGELAKTAHQSDFFMKCIMHFLNMFCFHWCFCIRCLLITMIFLHHQVYWFVWQDTLVVISSISPYLYLPFQHYSGLVFWMAFSLKFPTLVPS